VTMVPPDVLLRGMRSFGCAARAWLRHPRSDRARDDALRPDPSMVEDDGTPLLQRTHGPQARPHDRGFRTPAMVDLSPQARGGGLTRLIEPGPRCPACRISSARAPAWFGAVGGRHLLPGSGRRAGARERSSGHRLYRFAARAKPSRTSSSKYLTQAPLVVAPRGR